MRDNTEKEIKCGKYFRDNVMSAVGQGKKYHSLSELAKAMGVSASTLTHALKNNPRLDTIQRISDTLGISVATLFEKPLERSVEGYAVVSGKLMRFNNVADLESVVAEAKKPTVHIK